MHYSTNSRGDIFRHGVGGTYPCNNGDPQNDDEDAPNEIDGDSNYVDRWLDDAD